MVFLFFDFLRSLFLYQQVRMHLSSDLAGGGELAAALGAGQDVLAVLVELELGDDDVGGVDAEGDGLAGGLVAGDALDVDDVFEAVDGGDLALGALVGAADNGDLVVLADGDGADLFTMLAFPSLVVLAKDALRAKRGPKRTLYFSRSSLERGALMMTRRWLEGALK